MAAVSSPIRLRTGHARAGRGVYTAVPPPSRPQMHELLAERDFVRALARQLIAGDAAEDLAQDAWVRVLRPHRGVREPRRWLARVLRNLAANRRREERRRRRRETDAVGEPMVAEGPSPAEVLACEEVRQRVVAAVLGLEEPFRATVLARFYECLDAGQIAARHGVALATVRSRLKRGLDKLRARLDAEHGGRAVWAAPLALLGKGGVPLPFPILGVLMSTTKKIALLAGVLLLAGWSLWMLTPRGEAPARMDMASSALGSQSSTPAVAPKQEAPAADRVAVADTDGRSSPAGPGPRLPFPVLDVPIDEVLVRVMDAATRQPVAGATLLSLPFRIDFDHPRVMADRVLQETRDSDAFLERFGHRSTSAADGTATIRLPRPGGRVVATSGDGRAEISIEPGRLAPSERICMWLEDPRWIWLRVVDAGTGQPIGGAMVEYLALGCGGTIGPSDHDGRLRISTRRYGSPLHVRPRVVGRCEWTLVDLPKALACVTDLRVPATGSMTIELRTPSGQLWPTQVEATATPVEGSADGAMGEADWSRAQPGVHRMPFVQTGMVFHVTARPRWFNQYDAAASGMATIPGPTRAGEEVRVVLTTRSDPCILNARLQSEGAPLPIGAMVSITGPTSGPAWVDSEGRVLWTVPLGKPADGRIEWCDRSAMTRARPGAAWTFDQIATPGLHDLGTLELVEPPVVVAGDIDTGDGAWNGPPLQLLVEVAGTGERWDPLPKVEVDPAASLSFRVRALTDGERIRVSVLPARHFLAPEPVVVAIGTRDLHLRVARGLPLLARILAPTDYARAMECHAVREDDLALPPTGAVGDSAAPRSVATLVDFDGEAATYSWPSLPPGSYRVDVTAPGMQQPLACIPAVKVGEDAAADPRLDPIDVGGRGRLLTVRVVPLPNGPRPITEGGVAASPCGSQAENVHGMLFDDKGTARLLVGPGPVDLIVAVPGHRLWRSENVTDSSVQVALEPCLQAPLRLSPRIEERLAGCRLEVRLVPCPAEPSGAMPWFCFLRPGERVPAMELSRIALQSLDGTGKASIEISPAGQGTIPVSAAGAFELAIAVQAPNGTRWSPNTRPKGLLMPARVVVHGDDDPPFVIDLTDAALEHAMLILSRRR